VRIDHVRFSLFGYAYTYASGAKSPVMAISNQALPHTMEASEKFAADYVARKNEELRQDKAAFIEGNSPGRRIAEGTKCVLVRYVYCGDPAPAMYDRPLNPHDVLRVFGIKENS
jgi:hypothetical protein